LDSGCKQKVQKKFHKGKTRQTLLVFPVAFVRRFDLIR
jgi:hypothetical protein